MGTLTIKGRTLNTSYEYVNESVTVNGGFVQEDATGELRNINGSVILNTTGAQIGSFNGYRNGQTMVYNQSDVPFNHLLVFLTAIQEIEQEISNDNGNDNANENDSGSSEGGEE